MAMCPYARQGALSIADKFKRDEALKRAKCIRHECAVWWETHTTEGHRIEVCGLIHPEYTREV